MIRVDKCPVCGCEHFAQSMPAYMSTFVIDRMLGQPKGTVTDNRTTLFQCSNCFFVGADMRFNEEEERRYYNEYMADEYNKHRDQYEGTQWNYFQKYYESEEYIKLRKQAALELLNSVIDVSQIESVLDYGGDTGEMVPDEFANAKRYLLDVNERSLANGFVAVNSPEESGQVELVMCSHVMEHVSYPGALLDDIKRYLVSGGCVYIEVPSEDPGPSVHEHINFINYYFLEKLLKDKGFKVLGAVNIAYPVPMTKSMAIVGILE
jgi:SAM-dependent methyltransferase